MISGAVKLVFTFSLAIVVYAMQQPDVRTIIERSVAANRDDFNAAPDFNDKETDKTPTGNKTYQITMIEGTPYQRLIAVDGKPLPPDQEREQMQRQQQVTARRRAETPEQRQARIAKWRRERTRDNAMMDQLTKAFNFDLVGEGKLRDFTIWILKATPRPGYRPPNMYAQVLTGMQGELWVDQQTYQWVKVMAQVIHPVSIQGFLARVEPGTQFELEKSPVSGGTWQVTHFSMKSHARVLFLFARNGSEDTTYFDYERVGRTGQNAEQASRR